MAVSGRSCRNEWRKNLFGANDSVCSGTSDFINGRRSGAKPWTCRNIVQVLCSGCDRNLKSGTQCESCGRWYHNSCENVKRQVAESGKWTCDRCRAERFGVLEEKLRVAQIQIEELKRIDKALEEQLLLSESGKDVGKGDTVTVKLVGEKCLVLGDSIVRNVGAQKSKRVQCFPGIRADQLRRVMENRGLGYSDAVVIHVGKNDVRRCRNLDYVMGEVYDLVNTAKAIFLGSRLVLNPYPTAFPYGNGMVLHFYQQQESSTTKTVHKVINKGLKTYV